jgi:hypothetical protein
MKKLVIALVLLISLSFVSAQAHSASEVQIIANGNSMTLQNAINQGYFRATGNTYNPATIVSGHTTTQIWVSVKSGEMTLANALQSSGKLCPASPPKTTYSSSAIPNPSHLATDITLSSGKSFQKAINDGDYCCVPQTCAQIGPVGGTRSDGCGGTLCCPATCASLNRGCGSWSDGCGGTLNCGSCSSPNSCIPNPCTFGSCRGDLGYSCRCTPATCASLGKVCGDWPDGCGGTASCGSCIVGSCIDDGKACYNPPINIGKITVICSELHRQGLMSDEIYLADEKFGEQLLETHPEILKGYTMFATPIVEKMQESEEFTQTIKTIAEPWTEEMAYRVGARESGNFVGAMMMNVGMVIFWITGSLAMGQIGMLFLTQITIALFVVSMIYLNKSRKK